MVWLRGRSCVVAAGVTVVAGAGWTASAGTADSVARRASRTRCDTESSDGAPADSCRTSAWRAESGSAVVEPTASRAASGLPRGSCRTLSNRSARLFVNAETAALLRAWALCGSAMSASSSSPRAAMFRACWSCRRDCASVGPESSCPGRRGGFEPTSSCSGSDCAVAHLVDASARCVETATRKLFGMTKSLAIPSIIRAEERCAIVPDWARRGMHSTISTCAVQTTRGASTHPPTSEHVSHSIVGQSSRRQLSANVPRLEDYQDKRRKLLGGCGQLPCHVRQRRSRTRIRRNSAAGQDWCDLLRRVLSSCVRCSGCVSLSGKRVLTGRPRLRPRPVSRASTGPGAPPPVPACPALGSSASSPASTARGRTSSPSSSSGASPRAGGSLGDDFLTRLIVAKKSYIDNEASLSPRFEYIRTRRMRAD